MLGLLSTIILTNTCKRSHTNLTTTVKNVRQTKLTRAKMKYQDLPLLGCWKIGEEINIIIYNCVGYNVTKNTDRRFIRSV